jgi:hypothetical protein
MGKLGKNEKNGKNKKNQGKMRKPRKFGKKGFLDFLIFPIFPELHLRKESDTPRSYLTTETDSWVCNGGWTWRRNSMVNFISYNCEVYKKKQLTLIVVRKLHL